MNTMIRDTASRLGGSFYARFGRIMDACFVLTQHDRHGATAASGDVSGQGRYATALEDLLITAGRPGGLTAIHLVGLQVLAAVGFPILWVLILYQSGWFEFLFEGPKQILFYLALALAGFLLPLMNIREKAASRQQSVALQLPDMLDLLTISVEAGLDFSAAMKRVVEKHRPGALRDELERCFHETERLGKGRNEALREMASRVRLQDLSAVVSALIQANQLGVSIGPILRVQSDMLRTRRSQRAEKAAHEAPVKMLAPLILCIMPAVFIMILGPVIIQMIRDASH
ncbi:MAG: type II secretion system F family protein [Verrucomicrobia bacterium]|nr:type II secretion system F family protein [Verrucomicrobiota bacterium]